MFFILLFINNSLLLLLPAFSSSSPRPILVSELVKTQKQFLPAIRKTDYSVISEAYRKS